MKTFYALLALFIVAISDCAHADTFGSGPNAFTIEFVTIGNPGNAADASGNPNPAGAVPYEYRIGRYEISEDMIDKSGLGITINTRAPNKPATSLSWFDAARFVNLLNTNSGSVPAYNFDRNGNFHLWSPSDSGYNPNNLYRNNLARYFLPSVDEWYKAAYYNPISGTYYNYPTGSDTAPTAAANGTAPGTAVYGQPWFIGPADITLAGGLSPYGTMAQGGNVLEWEETDPDLVNDAIDPWSFRAFRGGDWFSDTFNMEPLFRFDGEPNSSGVSVGFRVASTIPEPSTCSLLAMAIFASVSTRCCKSVPHDRV